MYGKDVYKRQTLYRPSARLVIFLWDIFIPPENVPHDMSADTVIKVRGAARRHPTSIITDFLMGDKAAACKICFDQAA